VGATTSETAFRRPCSSPISRGRKVPRGPETEIRVSGRSNAVRSSRKAFEVEKNRSSCFRNKVRINFADYRREYEGVTAVRRLLAVIAILASACALAGAAQADTDFSIRFSEKKVYFLGDEILVEALVVNTGTSTLRFKVADNRVFNLDFDVHTATNVALEHAREFTTRRTSDQPVFYRELSLEPGEQYAIVVDLAEYTAFQQPGLYVLQARFYPELFRTGTSTAIASNRLTLNLRPGPVTQAMREDVTTEEGVLLARDERLPPDEVVKWTITARQKSEWDKFFLYLDLEQLLRKNDPKNRAYRNASEDARQAMVEQFKQDLRQSRIDGDIHVIPYAFEIQKTEYGPEAGTVRVLEKFKYPDYVEKKLYTYHLQRKDKFWIIADYEIKNMGTE
jgi:hypothetical protein